MLFEPNKSVLNLTNIKFISMGLKIKTKLKEKNIYYSKSDSLVCF